MLLITIDDMPEEKVDYISRVNKCTPTLQTDLKNSTIPLDKVEVLITYGSDVTKETLNCMPSLKWIQVFQTGIEHMPLKELDHRGIMLTNVKGIYGIPISEYVMSVILYFTRDISRFIDNKRNPKRDGLWAMVPDQIRLRLPL